MFLLNEMAIEKHIEDDNGILFIDPFLSDNLGHTFYYFRLGSKVKVEGKDYIEELSEEEGKQDLVLEPDGFATIESLEKFRLGDKILGVLGQTSRLAEKGIQLLHSPFIDPSFPGKELKLGIKNLTKKPVPLRFAEEKIGKVCFFNISDTYPMNIDKNKDFYQRFLRKKIRNSQR